MRYLILRFIFVCSLDSHQVYFLIFHLNFMHLVFPVLGGNMRVQLILSRHYWIWLQFIRHVAFVFIWQLVFMRGKKRAQHSKSDLVNAPEVRIPFITYMLEKEEGLIWSPSSWGNSYTFFKLSGSLRRLFFSNKFHHKARCCTIGPTYVDIAENEL